MKKKKMTNAEKIRNMSAEKLVDFLECLNKHCLVLLGCESVIVVVLILAIVAKQK